MSHGNRKEVHIKETELEIQKGFIERIKEVNAQEQNRSGAFKKYLTITFGCQMNAHDSEKISGMLNEMGYRPAQDESDADIIIYNTCCIRENAENKMFGHLGRVKTLKARNKNLRVVLCGCMMQQDAVIDKIKKSYNFVDVIFGTYNLYRLPQLLYTNMETSAQVIDIWEEQREIVEDLPSIRKSKFKASVNIMYGCNNFCTYCIVPYVRGRERSREPWDILKEVERLVADGVKEIMLLGQNVNSYGKNLANPISFAELLDRVAKTPGLERIRFMTSHPKDFSDDLIHVIGEHKNICRHIHLPIQSGSSAMLKKMNRSYHKESYLSLVDRIKRQLPEIALTTDIIVGFPGETDFDNDETIDVLKKVRYHSAFTFIYSPRNGTPAAVMADKIDEKTAKQRFNKVLDVLNPIIREQNEAQVGTIGKVLVESFDGEGEGPCMVSGRLDNNTLVHLEGTEEMLGQIMDVRITGCKTFYLTGVFI